MAKKRLRSQRQSVGFPSAYRYLALGLLLPVFVVVGMIIGYNYGAPIGDLQAAFFGAAGGMAGLMIATVIIVRVTLLWDKRILLALKKSRPRRSQSSLRAKG